MSFTTLWIYTILKPAERGEKQANGFTTLWIYTILKLNQCDSVLQLRFTTLWIYTILKPAACVSLPPPSFTTLWIYTILKLYVMRSVHLNVSLPYGFTLFSNRTHCHSPPFWFHYLMDLHYSQTRCNVIAELRTFHYLMDLHYSQTSIITAKNTIKFHYLMDLHYSQTDSACAPSISGFTTLWIYTILKRRPLWGPYGLVSLPYGFTLFSNKGMVKKQYNMFHYLMDLHYSQTN